MSVSCRGRGVDWDDAQAYVEWLSRETGEEYRLLSESEWEYVARAETGTRYWWGARLAGTGRTAMAAGAGGFVFCERIRAARRARERKGVVGGLLERELRRSAGGRESMDDGELQPAGAARRFLEPQTEGPPLRLPQLVLRRPPVRPCRFPCCPDAHAMSRSLFNLRGVQEQSPLVDFFRLRRAVRALGSVCRLVNDASSLAQESAGREP